MVLNNGIFKALLDLDHCKGDIRFPILKKDWNVGGNKVAFHGDLTTTATAILAPRAGCDGGNNAIFFPGAGIIHFSGCPHQSILGLLLVPTVPGLIFLQFINII